MNLKTSEGDRFIRGFNGSLSPVLGQVVLPVRIGSWCTDAEFHVASGVDKIILGIPGLSGLGVNVDVANARITQGQDAVLCDVYQDLSPGCELVQAALPTNPNGQS